MPKAKPSDTGAVQYQVMPTLAISDQRRWIKIELRHEPVHSFCTVPDEIETKCIPIECHANRQKGLM